MDASSSRTTGLRLLIHLFLIAAALAMIYPLLWMISSSLKPQNQIFTDLGLWPSEFHWENYAIGWRGIGVSFGQFFTNSLLIAVLVAIGNTLSCSMAAYAFGFEPVGSEPDALRAVVARDLTLWAQVVEQAAIPRE